MSKITIECRKDENSTWATVGVLENSSTVEAEKFIEQVKKNSIAAATWEYRVVESC
jgi:hypothetical protein